MIRNRLGAEEEKIPQIPWAKYTKVVYLSDVFVNLQNEDLKLEIERSGDFWGSYNSRDVIKRHMKLNRYLTNQIQKEFEKYEGGGWINFFKEWIHRTKTPDIPEGKKEWRPGKKTTRHWKTGQMGSDNTYNWDGAYWWGSTFEYLHFVTEDLEDGIIVMWHLGGDVRGNYSYPEVWIGDVGSFFSDQNEGNPGSSETREHYTEVFENGILWAYDQMGLFDPEKIEKLPKWVEEAVFDHPDLLWPELVEKLIPIKDRLPGLLARTVDRILLRKKIEEEKSSGQTYFWPGLYPDEP